MRSQQSSLHPRNKHTGRYDFDRLITKTPELKPFVVPNSYGDLSIDFANPVAVRVLNKALLKLFYDLDFWDIPEGFLCPPIPGRSDYIHNAADLLADLNQEVVPQGRQVRVLDVGVGASCIYPVIGACEYGWSFVGTDIDSDALASAQKIVNSNSKLTDLIEIKKQTNPNKILQGVVSSNEEFDLVICNPPFHKSLQDAQWGSRRKWKNLGREGDWKPVLNFGGKESELWCPGGELAFIEKMIQESVPFKSKVLWFSTLVSNKDILPALYPMLEHPDVDVYEIATVEMAQGQKTSRFVAWTYMNPSEREAWRCRRWK
jgi:23S rRNA (adenine1618-N6)-methyltransferase